MTDAQSRPLSLLERFALSRRLAGYPPNVCMIVTYPSGSALPTTAFLEKRIIELQEHFPTLSSRVDDARTTTPRITLRDQIWSPSEILQEDTYEPIEGDEKAQVTELLIAQKKKMVKDEYDVGTHPLWTVTRFVHPTKAETSTGYIAVIIDHIVSDGRGLLALTGALLANDISNLPFEKRENVPKLEDKVNIKPSISYFLPIVWEKLILPKLPAFIQSYFHTDINVWPGKVYRGSRKDAIPNTSIISLAPDFVSSLKIAIKAKGVKTLQPVLQTAFATAVWSVYRYTVSPFTYVAATPRSERDASLGHPYCTGNYVSQNKTTLTLGPKEDFWNIAKQMADSLSKPNLRSHERMAIGMLAFVPDGLVTAAEPDPHRPTKWEEFFLDSNKDGESWDESISVSNVGVGKLPPRATDLIWSQTSSPFGPPMAVNAVGHDGGMRLALLWREGTVVIEEEMKQVEAIVLLVLQNIIDGKGDATLEAFTKRE
ncbi:hypothetical protein CI109_103167 [Kwoniella shandongensis]|uniref:Uncharacterized protein n=1 Tax=Kwoniella shandongensis TaxID=1734106 RepID=A0A5M6C8M5_9TREE|nr:uncharacterized protein CI109_000358 [Kwoniella shandongensis]KAA5531516.1 hypothetical protein CI109_000358 [Kwoniella shandongensis]